MITLHRLGHPEEDFYVNHEMVVAVEANPDTVIRLVTGDKLLVAESAQEVAQRIRNCRAEVLTLALRLSGEERAADTLALLFGAQPNFSALDPPEGVS
jgi:uncharacterized protein YlzI (FlbEa/FlbD family)